MGMAVRDERCWCCGMQCCNGVFAVRTAVALQLYSVPHQPSQVFKQSRVEQNKAWQISGKQFEAERQQAHSVPLLSSARKPNKCHHPTGKQIKVAAHFTDQA
jgi:hypothetical protein